MILIGNKTPESITIGGKEVASIAINNETVWTSSQEEPVDDPVVTCVDNVVTMTCSTSGATINYSTDGGTTYSVYSTPITISATTNYTVYASKARMSDSNIVTYTATFKETVPTPVVTSEEYYETCPDGITTIIAGYQVTVTCSDQNATIYTRYVDGYWDEGLQEFVWNSDINQTPWNQSSFLVLYSGAGGGYLLQAKATRSGYNDSEIYETELQPPYEECPPDIDCTDCDNWEECGYASYEDCDFDQHGFLTQEATGGLDSRTESGSTVYTINARIYTGVPGCDYTIRKAGYPSNTYTDTNNNGYMLWTYDHADLVNGKSHFYVTVEKDGVSTGEKHYAAYDYGIETIE